MARLTGHITFHPGIPSLIGVPVHLFVENTTQADAPAMIARHLTLPVDIAADGTMPFTIDGIDVDERARYTLRVLVDMDQDTKISAGDYITMESFPVLTRGHPSAIAVTVRLVTE